MASGSFVGITRFQVPGGANGRGAYRFEESRAMWDTADALYRRVFAALGMPLAEGSRVHDGPAAEVWDRRLGIDVGLRTAGGRALTVQEKFLTTDFNTVTVEYMNDHDRNVPGDWFNERAQLYFVGYVNAATAAWRRWIFLHWSNVVVETEVDGGLQWGLRVNGRDGARASFRYIDMAALPPWCVLASSDMRMFRETQEDERPVAQGSPVGQGDEAARSKIR